jgi:hypothetical protein
MKNIILSTAIIGTLLFATPVQGTPPKKTVVINMINIDTHKHNEDKKYGKTWKVFIPNAKEVTSNHVHNGFEKPMNSNEDFRFQPCDE